MNYVQLLQKAPLTNLVSEGHDFTVRQRASLPQPNFFVADGVSGMTYDRPRFQAMLAEIEAGQVVVAITKDLFRLDGNSALTGLYTIGSTRTSAALI